MAHGYRKIQHWDQWLSQQFLGQQLIGAEKELLTNLLTRHYGKHVLLVGVPHQADLLSASVIPCHTLLSPLTANTPDVCHIESDFHELPIQTGSIDLVMLPHTLEFVENPRQLLAEACRVIKPEGLIAVTGFNQHSAWGLRKLLAKNKITPWSGHFFHLNKIKNWLRLADFELEQQASALFRPPVSHQGLFEKMHFMENIGRICFPSLGGVYVLLARAKVIPLTPIRMKWKQQLSGIKISTTISGTIARQVK